MKINKIVTTDVFNREFKRLNKKYSSFKKDIEKVEKDILKNPNLGVDLGCNIRKVRFAISSKNKGKRAGGRIITYDILTSVSEKEILFVAVYDKNDIDNISINKIRSIINYYGF
jgi:hypothetical protein